MTEVESAEEFYAKLQYIARAADNEHAAAVVSRVAIYERDAAIRRESKERIAQLERERDKVQDTVLQQHRRAEAAEAQVAKLRAALEEIMDYRGGADNPLEDEYVVARADAALVRTPAEALARQQAVARVVDAAREIDAEFTDAVDGENIVAREDGSVMQGWVELSRSSLQRLSDALAALDGGAGDD